MCFDVMQSFQSVLACFSAFHQCVSMCLSVYQGRKDDDFTHDMPHV